MIPASRVVAACGLAGAAWLEDQLRQAGVQLRTGPADFGIRLETTAAALSTFTGEFYDFKLTRQRRRDRAAQLLRQRRRVHRRRIPSRPGHPRRQRALLPGPRKRPVQPRHRRHHHPGAPCRPQSLRPPARRAVNAAAGGYPIRQQLADLLPGCQPHRPGSRSRTRKPGPADSRTSCPPPCWTRSAATSRRSARSSPPVLAADSAGVRAGDQVLRLPGPGRPDLAEHRHRGAVRDRQRGRVHRQPHRRRAHRHHRRRRHHRQHPGRAREARNEARS